MPHITSMPNQEPVSIRDLNQSHIGRPFVMQYGAATLFGTLGAVKIFPTAAALSLAGVNHEDLNVQLDDQVFFKKGI